MCTGIRFDDDNGNMYFGRNLDWSVGFGEKVVITPRNYKYKSAFLGELECRAGAIIGMAIAVDGKPLYFDCANESGLAVAGLNFTEYAGYEPDKVEGKTNIAAYEFPLFVAMNYKTVEEARKALANAVIVAKPVDDKHPTSELHYIIGDGKESIIVEYTKNGMEIFDNPVDVLTNQPEFNWHKENLRNYLNLFPQMPGSVTWGGAKMTAFGSGSLMRGLPGDYSSPSRFVRAAYLNTHYPVKSTEEENIARLFHTLAGVSMIDGAAVTYDGGFEKTIYTGGYSSATKTYYYNTYENPAIVKVALGDYDLDSSELIEV